jgi:hypothetical protein
VVAAGLLAAVALADTLVLNDVQTGGDTTLAQGDSGTATFFITAQTTPGDANGCNATGSSPATVTLTSDQTWLTLSQTSVTVIGCGTEAAKTVGYSVAATAPVGGVATITATATGGKAGSTYTPDSFTVTVKAPPAPADTAAPTITITTDAADHLATTGWYNAASSGTDGVLVHVSASDASGVSSLSCSDGVASVLDTTLSSGQFTLGDGTHSIACVATDTVGNSTAAGSQATAHYDVDQTAPAISGSASPAANANGWRKTDVTVSFSCSDAVSLVASCEADHVLGEGFGQSVTGQASDNAGNSNSATVSGINVDKGAPNAPSIAASKPVDYTDGAGNAWYKDSVTLTFSANGDPALADGHAGSGVDPLSVPAPVSRTTTGALSAAGTVTDNADNQSAQASRTVQVDADAPKASFGNCPSSPLILGSSASASWSASDVGSGLASAATGSVTLDTSSVGSHTAQSPAPSDNVGHTGAAASCVYSVIYDFHGFFQPVDNGGIFNVAKAGSAIPVKFDLGGNQGLGILAAGSPAVSAAQCPTSTALQDTIEETTAATNSGLQFDATANLPFGQYIYVWKTAASFAGTCKMLNVKLIDGTSHTALFKFTK